MRDYLFCEYYFEKYGNCLLFSLKIKTSNLKKRESIKIILL